MTNPYPRLSQQLSVDDLLKTNTELQKGFAEQLKGIPVRVDRKLLGNQFYCMISQEVYEQIVSQTETALKTK